jgi:hypothetical protein
MLGMMFLFITGIYAFKKRMRLVHWAFTVSAFTLIYLSTQRGAFYAALSGFLVFFLRQQGRRRVQTITVFILVIATVFVTDNLSRPEKQDIFKTRSGLMTGIGDIGARFNIVFLWLAVQWAKEKPFGSFLGFAGPEGATFPSPALPKPNFEVETGAALLIADTGIAGAILFPFVVFRVVRRILKKSKGLECRGIIVMLVTFMIAYFVIYYVKVQGAMNSLNIAQLIFWATPGICARLIIDEKERKAAKFIQTASEVTRPAVPTGAIRP